MTDSLQIAMNVIYKYINFGDCGLYDNHNCVGDAMRTIYEDDNITIMLCERHNYFEVFGLTDEDFDKLHDFYNDLRGGNRD